VFLLARIIGVPKGDGNNRSIVQCNNRRQRACAHSRTESQGDLHAAVDRCAARWHYRVTEENEKPLGRITDAA